MDDQQAGRNNRQLLRVLQAAVALSLGAMSAFFFSVRQVNPDIRFEFSAGTVAGFVLAAAGSWMAWPLVVSEHRSRRTRLKWLLILLVVLGLGTVVPFAIALRNVPGAKVKEFAQGAGLAVVVLVFFGLVVRRIGRMFERASANELEAIEKSDEGK